MRLSGLFRKKNIPPTKELDITPPPNGQRLNLGCGNDYRNGYINIDLNDSHKVDVVDDVTWLKTIKDNSASEVLALDILEHLPKPQCQSTLREWNRVMVPKGILNLRVPSLKDLLKLFDQEDFSTFERQELLVQNLFGTQHYQGDFHHNGFTEITLHTHLEKAGFKLLKLSIIDGWLFDAIARKIDHTPPDPLLRVDDDTAFIYRVYATYLQKQPDPEALGYYTKLIVEQKLPREVVIESIQTSDEYKRLLDKQAA